MSQRSGESGLPDYVADHFNYLVRCGAAARFGQALFFISSLALPVSLMAAAVTFDIDGIPRASILAIVIAFGVFVVSIFWYLTWMEIRLHRFRRERRLSYDRWYGFRKKSRLDLGAQFRLAGMQARYVFFGKEPSPSETLALSMRMARR